MFGLTLARPQSQWLALCHSQPFIQYAAFLAVPSVAASLAPRAVLSEGPPWDLMPKTVLRLPLLPSWLRQSAQVEAAPLGQGQLQVPHLPPLARAVLRPTLSHQAQVVALRSRALTALLM